MKIRRGQTGKRNIANKQHGQRSLGTYDGSCTRILVCGIEFPESALPSDSFWVAILMLMKLPTKRQPNVLCASQLSPLSCIVPLRKIQLMDGSGRRKAPHATCPAAAAAAESSVKLPKPATPRQMTASVTG